MAHDDLARIGLLHPAEQAQQGRLAGAVEAQDDDAATAIDGQVHACEDLQGAVGLGQAARAQRGLAAGGGIGEAQTGDPLGDPLILQTLHEAVGALEHLLSRDGLGRLGAHLLPLSAQSGGLLLRVGALATTAMLIVRPLLEIGVPAQVIDVEDASIRIQVHDLVDGVAQELDVVADDDEAAGVGAQMVAQPQHGVVVEMVGGLVQQQRVGPLEENSGEFDAAPLAARQRADLLVQDPIGQPESGGDARRLTRGRVAAGHGELVVHTRVAVQGLGHGVALGGGNPLLRFANADQKGVNAAGGENTVPGGLGEVPDPGVLREVPDRSVAGDGALVLDGLQAMAVVGIGDRVAGALLDGSGGQKLGHGGLTGAIASDQPDAHALIHPEGRTGDELAGADAHDEVLDVDHARHRTIGAGRSPTRRRREAPGHRSQ